MICYQGTEALPLSVSHKCQVLGGVIIELGGGVLGAKCQVLGGGVIIERDTIFEKCLHRLGEPDPDPDPGSGSLCCWRRRLQ